MNATTSALLVLTFATIAACGGSEGPTDAERAETERTERRQWAKEHPAKKSAYWSCSCYPWDELTTEEYMDRLQAMPNAVQAIRIDCMDDEPLHGIYNPVPDLVDRYCGIPRGECDCDCFQTIYEPSCGETGCWCGGTDEHINPSNNAACADACDGYDN